MPHITVAETVAAVTAQWVADGAFSEQTMEKFVALAHRFAAFSAAKGVMALDDVDQGHVASFVCARGRARNGTVVAPQVSTMQNRRAVLRAFYRTARTLGLTFADPARDVQVPSRDGSVTRPLTTAEAELVWFHGWDAGRDTRYGPTVALLLSGVHSGEAAHIALADLDVAEATVLAHGALKYEPRTLALEPKFLRALCVRAERVMNRNMRTPAAAIRFATEASGTDAQLQARVGMTVREVLVRAGLGDDATLKPSSLTAYAGAQAFARTGRVEDAAKVLGLRSLDAAARTIGYRWAV